MIRDNPQYQFVFQQMRPYSTKIAAVCEIKEDNPSGSRCGSVETCRKAAGISLSCLQERTRKW
jgi:hypothetical protein